METSSALFRAEKNDASRQASIDAVTSIGPGYGHFVSIAKFVKHFKIDKQRDYFMARDKRTNDVYMSMYGEGIRVTWEHPSQGQPKKMEVLDKSHRFNNATEFAFALYRAVEQMGLL